MRPYGRPPLSCHCANRSCAHLASDRLFFYEAYLGLQAETGEDLRLYAPGGEVVDYEMMHWAYLTPTG